MNAKKKLLEEVYVIAHGNNYVLFAINNDMDMRDVREFVKDVTGESLSVEHRGSFNDLNDEWRVTF